MLCPLALHVLALIKPESGGAMGSLIGKLRRNRHAQDLAEYGLALGVIGAGAAAMALAFADNVNAVWASANTAIQDAVDLIAGP